MSQDVSGLVEQLSEKMGTAAKRYGHQEETTSQAMKNAGGGYAF
ncbi:hypothetical protein ACFQ1S_34560 [Kibdelosporangium lantanae]|uniref:WXG100 family type VII secretion target n=1 Tax=Kibdelosporangium lantanae TaxID=1497396 RepID=A0ABW3MLI8_9PSEU